MITAATRYVALMVLCGLVATVQAEPVEVRQGDSIGAGYTFRRGTTCTVVTVRHAVPYEGVDVQVTDRTGGTALGQRSYDNEVYDLALVALPANSAVACTAGWPDTAWLAAAKFTTKNTFEIVRHTPDNRETIVLTRYVGGTPDTLTLAPVDKMKARVTFSGSVVRSDDSLLALVQKLDPATDRIEALRFDVIDRLVGSRFKGTSQGIPVHLEGVFKSGRDVPNWTTYVGAWLREQGGRPTVAAQDPKARCSIRVNVIDWARENVSNPEYAALEQRYTSCGTLGIGGMLVVRSSPEAKASCQKQVRAKMTEVGRYQKGHRLTMESVVTPRTGSVASKLETVTVVLPKAAAPSRTEEELAVLQRAAGSMLEGMFAAGACD